MLTLSFNPFPLILTNRLVLRKVFNSDVNEMFFLRSDKRVLQYLDRAPVESTEEAFNFFKKLDDLEKNNDAVTWAITLKKENKLIGIISFWNIKKEHYRAEIGYSLHPDYQGKGIMQEALTNVLDFGFKIMKLHSVEANVNPNNFASIKLLERNNFIREGYFKEDYYFNGKFSDSVIYSLLSPIKHNN